MFHIYTILKYYLYIFIDINIFNIKLYLSMRLVIIFFHHEPVNIIYFPDNIGKILFQFLRVIIFELKKIIFKKMVKRMMFGLR